MCVCCVKLWSGPYVEPLLNEGWVSVAWSEVLQAQSKCVLVCPALWMPVNEQMLGKRETSHSTCISMPVRVVLNCVWVCEAVVNCKATNKQTAKTRFNLLNSLNSILLPNWLMGNGIITIICFIYLSNQSQRIVLLFKGWSFLSQETHWIYASIKVWKFRCWS